MISLLKNKIKILFINRTLMFYYNKIWKMNIDETSYISTATFLDKTNPKGIYIGKFCQITRNVKILTHDYSRGIHANTVIGNNVFIGVNSIVLPGVTIADNVIIGAGSVVTKDIESFSIAAGNPCKIIKQGVNIGKYGCIINK